MKKLLVLFLIIVYIIVLVVSCDIDANVASRNLSQDAEMFKIYRRVVFYNGITDTYILQIEGFCSVDFYTNKFVVTVKTGDNEFKKYYLYYLGRADNVFPFVEQLDPANVSTYHYKVIFKPSVIIPDIDIK